MKTNLLLLLLAMFTFILNSCELKEPLDAYTPHFHAKAEQMNETQVEATIKVPGRLSETLVYLKEVKPINQVQFSEKQREELVLAELVFTTDKEQELESTEFKKGGSWDAKCDVLTITGQAKNVKIASIFVRVPEGVNKLYKSTKREFKKDPCYSQFAQQSIAPISLHGLVFLHPGHEPPMDPEFGKDGIPISPNN